MQVREGVDISHIEKAARLARREKVRKIIVGGDVADNPASGKYDRGTIAGECARIKKDIDATNFALRVFMKCLVSAFYQPEEIVMAEGNHEVRLNTLAYENPHLEGIVGTHLLDFKKWGWKVYPFLQPFEVDGTLVSHFFPAGHNGKIRQNRNGAPSALAQMKRQIAATGEAVSMIAGHAQTYDFVCQDFSGRLVCSLIAGSFYSHTERYLGPMSDVGASGNRHWRGCVLLTDVRHGYFVPHPIAIEDL